MQMLLLVALQASARFFRREYDNEITMLIELTQFLLDWKKDILTFPRDIEN